MQRRALTLTGLVLVLLSPVVPPADAGSSPAVSLALSPAVVTYGSSQDATGYVMADSPCPSGRTVDLQQRPSGSVTWATIDTATSDTNGSFGFASRQPDSTASYRAVAEPAVTGGTTCDQLTSPAERGLVRAAVTFTLAHTSVPAGSCTKGAVRVRPTKAGQQVTIQERGTSGWRALRTLTLDASSNAVTTFCERWVDIGRHRLRATWTKQDDVNATGSSPASVLSVVRAAWMRHIGQMIGGRTVGVSIRAKGSVLYERGATSPFAPASNEKLPLSMALLDRMGPGHRIDTVAAAGPVRHGVIRGNLWILGHGDPSTGPGQLKALAGATARAGVKRIKGRVMGSTTYFAHDWWAPGWKPSFPHDEIPLPSALTFKGNRIDGRNVAHPELFAAKALFDRLRARGIAIGRHRPGYGAPPSGLTAVAAVHSVPLSGLLRHMDRTSDNFYAEVLGKGLAASVHGPPGTIAHGAGAIAAWARAHGANATLYDSSGLSYRDRITPHGLTRLLQVSSSTTWGSVLRRALPAAGQGTLHGRHLAGVKLHAKTGTLDNISALSGWVWLSKVGTWAQFSILDRGMGYTTAKDLEDAIVRTMASSAH
jgi:serine-type D-Ala-D-Ala carboxypeptidase/endopeptidase (penicillin-binding protein 4)